MEDFLTMKTIKTFSEGIQGSVVDYTDESTDNFVQFVGSAAEPVKVQAAFETIERNRKAIEGTLPKNQPVPSWKAFDGSKKIIESYKKELLSEGKGILSKDPILRDRINAALKTKHISKLSLKEVVGSLRTGETVTSVKGPFKTRPKNIENAIRNLRKAFKGGSTATDVQGAKTLLKAWAKEISETGTKMTGPSKNIYNAEKAYIQKIIDAEFPTPKVTGQAVAKATPKVEAIVKTGEEAAAKITPKVDAALKGKVLPKTEQAEKVLRAVAAESKTLSKVMTKTLIKKLVSKVVPFLGIGLTALALTKEVQKVLVENAPEEFDENSVIPHGENYHRDVGWY
jgi:hypothetical protein